MNADDQSGLAARPNLAVLVSGSGSTLQALLEDSAAGRLAARVAVVIASRPGIGAIDRAAAANVSWVTIDRRRYGEDVATFSRDVFAAADATDAPLACCAGWLCLLDLPPTWAGRVMNVHPSLLPSFGGRGMYGRRVHEAVLASGCRVSGCTVHYLDATYDTGPIVTQRCCAVYDDDTPETLAARVQTLERDTYLDAIHAHLAGRLTVQGRRVVTRRPVRE